MPTASSFSWVHAKPQSFECWSWEKEIKGINCNVPQGAFYLFPDVSYYFGKSDGEIKINSSDDLCMYLLNTCFVALVAGTPFGSPECVRLSYAASEENLLEAISRIKNQLAKLKWHIQS